MDDGAREIAVTIARPAAAVTAFARDPRNLPAGATVRNPLRVLAAGPGCRVVFTLRRTAATTDAEFAADAAAVTADLARPRDLLEQ